MYVGIILSLTDRQLDVHLLLIINAPPIKKGYVAMIIIAINI